MKKFTPYILWFVAGAILGFIADNLLGALWIQLGWRQPIANWLASHGFSALASYWGLVWIRLPVWIIAAIVGICGGIFIRRQPIPSLLIFGIGFVVMPVVATAIAGFSPTVFGLGVWFKATMWDCISIVLLLAFAFLGFRFREHKKHAA
jgi:hypothetical protein